MLTEGWMFRQFTRQTCVNRDLAVFCVGCWQQVVRTADEWVTPQLYWVNVWIFCRAATNDRKVRTVFFWMIFTISDIKLLLSKVVPQSIMGVYVRVSFFVFYVFLLVIGQFLQPVTDTGWGRLAQRSTFCLEQEPDLENMVSSTPVRPPGTLFLLTFTTLLIPVLSENDSRVYLLIVLTTDYCWRSWTCLCRVGC